MPTCPNGHANRATARFCETCGIRLDTEATPLVTTPIPPPPPAAPPLASEVAPPSVAVPSPPPAAPPDRVHTPAVLPTDSGAEPKGATEGVGAASPVTASAGSKEPPKRGRTRLIAALGGVLVLAIAGGAAAFLASRHSPRHLATGNTTTSKTSRPTTTTTSTTTTTTTTTSTTTSTTTTTVPSVPTGSGNWTYPQPIDQTAFQNNSNIDDTSCPQGFDCYAVDTAGNVLSSGGRRSPWSIVESDSQGLAAISCPTVSFCVAVDSGGNAIIDANGTWSDPISVDGSNSFVAISCPSTTFCMATDSSGDVAEFTGNDVKWALSQVDANNQPTDISCPTTSFCVLTDNNGDVLTWNGQAWSSPDQITNANSDDNLSAVSCANTKFCVAVDGTESSGNGGGYAYDFNGSTWTSTLVSSSAPLDAIACPAAGTCIATDNTGGVRVYEGGVWSQVSQIDGNNSFNDIACSSASSCAAIDNQDNLLYYSVSRS